MENISRVIVSLVYYNSLVRDTLEYTLNKQNYDAKFYLYKQNGIINEPKINSPLHVFIEQNKEKGEALLKKLETFGEDFYSEKSQVITYKDDTVSVDHSQNLKIFEAVIPLHEELNAIIRLHENFAKQNNQLEARIQNLLLEDERMYRAVAMFTLTQELFKNFEEFNKAMRENNGQANPVSNFVQNELNSVVKLLGMVRQYASCTDAIYTKALDSLFNTIEMMSGKRDLPQGKNFGNVFQETNSDVTAFLADAEPKFKANYEPLIRELIESSNKPAEEKSA